VACYSCGGMWVAGADACRGGWIRAARETRRGTLRFELAATAAALMRLDPEPDVLCIDIPIGLPDAGGRECDGLARAMLGWPRRSSVFPAPIRPALAARTREEASRITLRADGRRVGTQAWALYPKIREVDELLGSSSAARRRVREVHPEISFWAWNGGKPIQEGKKTPEGRAKRLRLVEGWLGSGLSSAARAGLARRAVQDDDILDVLAALWTATRVAPGSARTLPDPPPLDAAGLPMQIVY